MYAIRSYYVQPEQIEVLADHLGGVEGPFPGGVRPPGRTVFHPGKDT